MLCKTAPAIEKTIEARARVDDDAGLQVTVAVDCTRAGLAFLALARRPRPNRKSAGVRRSADGKPFTQSAIEARSASAASERGFGASARTCSGTPSARTSP
jgi:hypothetical protein